MFLSLSISISLFLSPRVCVCVCLCSVCYFTTCPFKVHTIPDWPKSIAEDDNKKWTGLARNVPFLPWHPLTSVVSLFKKKNTVIAAIRLWFHTSIRGVSLSNDECKICWVSLYFPLLLSWTISREPIFFFLLFFGVRTRRKNVAHLPPPTRFKLVADDDRDDDDDPHLASKKERKTFEFLFCILLFRVSCFSVNESVHGSEFVTSCAWSLSSGIPIFLYRISIHGLYL